jgi:amino acid transporter
MLWIFGGVVSYAGLNVYLEFGVEIPRSGSEKNYLERIFRKPRHLALATFACQSVLLGFSTSNCYAFGLYFLLALGIPNPSVFQSRAVALVCITSVVVLHGMFPRAGRALFNILGFFKVAVLIIITLSGLGVMTGMIELESRPNNFKDMFKNDGFGGDMYSFAIALLRIFYSYRGWDNCNTVMGEIRNPARTMGIAGPLAIGLVMFLYCFSNLAYFAVVSKEQIVDSGVIIAGNFFRIIFGDSASGRILPFLISLSNLGNILVVSYSGSRVNQELAKHYILPFSNIVSSLKPFGTPFVGLVIHWTLTVILLIAPPPGKVYEFVVDLSTYPVTFVSFSVTAGLLYLKWNHEKEHWGKKPIRYRSPVTLTILYLATNLFLMIVPWIPPPYERKPGDFPYYAVPLCGILILLGGPLYWLYWRNSPNAEKLELEIENGLYLQVD